jgi:hypothetical protein
MATLHIEHAVTDFETWNTAFGRFAEARRQSGVRQQRVQRWAQVSPNLLREISPVALELYFDEPGRDPPGAVLAFADDVLASLPAMAARAAPFPAPTEAQAVVLLYERDKLLRGV